MNQRAAQVQEAPHLQDDESTPQQNRMTSSSSSPLDFTTVISSSYPPGVEAMGPACVFQQWKGDDSPPFSCFLRLIEMENEGRAVLYDGGG